MKTTFLFVAQFAALAGLAIAQQPPPSVQSPEVHPDHSVIFRLRDPNAQKVTVTIAGRPDPVTLTKGEDGVWSVTSEPMAPDTYSYSFHADGVSMLDPSNSAIVPNLLSPSSVLVVPGPEPLPWDRTAIPHGVIHHHFYKSGIVGDSRDYYVYTPPGYDPAAHKRYPVLYLLHGYSDDARAWTAVGYANLILDGLIAQGKAKPMIIVMPLGYGDPDIVNKQFLAKSGSPFRNADTRSKNFDRFTDALLKEVIPMVDKEYRTVNKRESRAIAGLSMGGAETLLTGLNHLDTFAWVASFSAGGEANDFATEFPKLDAATANKQLRLLWIACGTDDRLITLNRSLVDWLKSKEINVTRIETPGMHAWVVWRRNLTALAPLLFAAGT
ncbi:MAG TPA: alpha/beta hydrolase-fold protein [Bryobacteraceae bacterium]|nr:alpha/beta hydrolase-fold protein [Bryobacteraceae bacterium]